MRDNGQWLVIAKSNIGAASATDAGYYFRWGELNGWKVNKADSPATGTIAITSVAQQGCVRDGTFANGKNTETAAANVFKDAAWPLYNKGTTIGNFSGVTDKTYNGARYGDAARYNWGGEWRMMTAVEVNALCNTSGGLANRWIDAASGGPGRQITADSYGTRTIFLPAAGYCNGGSLNYFGERGYYWSAVPYSAANSYSLTFGSSDCYRYYSYSYLGFTVRPVAVLPVEVDNDYFEDLMIQRQIDNSTVEPVK